MNKLIVFWLSAGRFGFDCGRYGKRESTLCSVLCVSWEGWVIKRSWASNLAGLSALYIEKSLVDYKKGARHDRRMSLIAQGLKKSQIKDLAAWYSAFEVTAKVPEI